MQMLFSSRELDREVHLTPRLLISLPQGLAKDEKLAKIEIFFKLLKHEIF